MKVLISSLILIFSINISYAQFPTFGGNRGKTIKGNISGKILDKLTNQPVAFATIALKKAGKNEVVNGVISDDNGEFKLDEVTNGVYDVVISFLGYQEMIMDSIETTLKDPDYNIGDILLEQNAQILDEVQITEKRSLFENKVDKIVYNAEDDSSVTGGDAADVLRNVPLLSVDLEGNVSLRGSQNVRILINGKPSGMFSSNVADALKMFPADQIKKVEVITSPGAKYDGEGTGGIINIITKRTEIEGVAGNINTSIGNRSSNGNLNLNIGKGRFGFTTNGAVFWSLPQDAENEFIRTSLSTGDELYRYGGVTNTERLGFSGSANAFYDFNAYNAINTNLTLRGMGFNRDGTNTGTFFDVPFERKSLSETGRSTFDWTSDYTMKFEGSDVKQLVFAVQASGNISNNESFIDESGASQREETIINDADNLELTGQIDYTLPVGNSNKLEMGVKSVIRNINSDSDHSVETFRSNLFLYDQNVYSGYMSYNFFFKKLNFVTGVRYEHTRISGDGDLDVQEFINDYDNILPNIAISKSFKGFRTIKVAYSRRIQRPSLNFINPFVNNSDFGNISQGNPFLNPELTDQIEMAYNTNFLGFTLFSSLYYRENKGIIEQVTTREDEIGFLNTFQNVGKNKSVGLNLFTSKNIGKFTFRGGGDIYTYNATGVIDGNEVSNDAISYRLFTSGDLSFTGSLKANFSGFFQAPRFTLQGQNPSFSIFSVGVRKEFNNSSLGIRIVSPFKEFLNFNSDITNETAGFNQVSSFAFPFRSFGISYSYKFGKVDFKERRSKVNNTDLKEGGGDQQGAAQSSGG
jgi:outer membrane receptor protein involved in Fe transport